MKRLTLITACLGALLGSSAVAQAATVYFNGADGGRTVRPKTMYLSADSTLDVQRVSWTQWGGRTAVGTGTAAYHGCDPSCAQGKGHRAAVTVDLYDRETCKGRVYYNRVKLVNRSTGKQMFASDLRLDKWAPCKE